MGQCKFVSFQHCSAHVLRRLRWQALRARSRVSAAVKPRKAPLRAHLRGSWGKLVTIGSFKAGLAACRQLCGFASPSSGARRQGSQVGWGGFPRASSVAQQSCGVVQGAQFLLGGVARFSYSRAMPAINRAPPNPSLKGRSNGVPPSLGHSRRSPIFCGPGLASHRWPPP
jgi:hypothetical protein